MLKMAHIRTSEGVSDNFREIFGPLWAQKCLGIQEGPVEVGGSGGLASPPFPILQPGRRSSEALGGPRRSLGPY